MIWFFLITGKADLSCQELKQWTLCTHKPKRSN